MVVRAVRKLYSIKIARLSVTPIILALLGAELNWLVVRANGGMPVRGIDIYQAYDRWIPLVENTRLKFLADILPFHYSIGDIVMFLAAGIFVYSLITYSFNAAKLEKNETG